MARRKKVLITGAAGRVGRSLRKHLGDRYDFRLLDVRPVSRETVPEMDAKEDVVAADMADYDAMVAAARGVDAIVHLALASERAGMSAAQVELDVNMKGTYNIFEAARVERVRTVVFASTNHVTGINEELGICSHADEPVRPDGLYGAAKAFGEALGRFYADRHGLRVFCLRIGNFPGDERPATKYEPGRSRWLSPRDLAQLVWRCIEAEKVSWGIYYGVSKSAEEKWDISNAREEIGYEPEDDGSIPA